MYRINRLLGADVTTSFLHYTPPPLGFTRVDMLNLLGVLIDPCLTFSPHVSRAAQRAAQTTFTLKNLKSFGLLPSQLSIVFRSTLVARLTYASPSWWGPILLSYRDRLQKVLNRASKWQICPSSPLSIHLDFKRFLKISALDTHLFSFSCQYPSQFC